MDAKLKTFSKFLSLVLRHDPDKIKITLDRQGWTDVRKLLAALKYREPRLGADLELLRRVVEENDKGRFEFSADGARVRARQGHSVPVELGDEQKEPPEWLYHGTPKKFAKAIRSGGLLKMSRHAVHLSPDYETAEKVGSRRGNPFVLMVRAKAMHKDGHEFYLTANNVWYTVHVPVAYLLWPWQRPHKDYPSRNFLDEGD